MSAEIVVMSDRKWFGDPRRYGMYDVLLDGRRAGVLPPRGRVVLRCDSGSHRVRVRQAWGLSPTLEVHLREGQTVSLQADMRDRDRSALRRAMTLFFRPGRFLSLRVVPGGEVSREVGE